MFTGLVHERHALQRASGHSASNFSFPRIRAVVTKVRLATPVRPLSRPFPPFGLRALSAQLRRPRTRSARCSSLSASLSPSRSPVTPPGTRIGGRSGYRVRRQFDPFFVGAACRIDHVPAVRIRRLAHRWLAATRPESTGGYPARSVPGRTDCANSTHSFSASGTRHIQSFVALPGRPRIREESATLRTSLKQVAKSSVSTQCCT